MNITIKTMKNIVYYSCSCGKVDGASTTVRDASSEVYNGMTANKCCREALVTDSRTGKRRKVFNNTVWDNNDAVCPNCGDGMIASEGCKNCESIGRKLEIKDPKDIPIKGVDTGDVTITLQFRAALNEDGGFMYDIWTSSEPDLEDGGEDGGQCTTTFLNAVDMATSQAIALLKRKTK